MITKDEWDMIAKCVAGHPPCVNTDDAEALIQKLQQMSQGEFFPNRLTDDYYE